MEMEKKFSDVLTLHGVQIGDLVWSDAHDELRPVMGVSVVETLYADGSVRPNSLLKIGDSFGVTELSGTAIPLSKICLYVTDYTKAYYVFGKYAIESEFKDLGNAEAVQDIDILALIDNAVLVKKAPIDMTCLLIQAVEKTFNKTWDFDNRRWIDFDGVKGARYWFQSFQPMGLKDDEQIVAECPYQSGDLAWGIYCNSVVEVASIGWDSGIGADNHPRYKVAVNPILVDEEESGALFLDCGEMMNLEDVCLKAKFEGNNVLILGGRVWRIGCTMLSRVERTADIICKCSDIQLASGDELMALIYVSEHQFGETFDILQKTWGELTETNSAETYRDIFAGANWCSTLVISEPILSVKELEFKAHLAND